ncbi:I'm not dead yet [Danaus plexippus plexippus]|uniref:I'm not dead yet n=1 Tax=Danaus plexippus plexippus TaxID=278856 RepID=A0A212FAQ8_DANPL|nr:I'm not dead yet [Danaus plexippus plexippus]
MLPRKKICFQQTKGGEYIYQVEKISYGETEKAPPLEVTDKLKIYLIVHWRGIITLLVPLLTIGILVPFPPEKWQWTAYCLLVMAVYWVTECIPLPVTAFLPVIVFPITGVMTTTEVCKCYVSDAVIMFLGSLMLAASVEQSGLHRRMAFVAIRSVGYSHRKLLVAMVIVTSFCSMWITNTAATTMMMPIIFAVLKVFEDQKLLNVYDTDVSGSKVASDIASCYFCTATFSATIVHEDLPKKPIRSVLDWAIMMAEMPFSFVFLLGGGFALSTAAKLSGLNSKIGECIQGLKVLPDIVIVLIIVTVVIMITNFASNIAVCNVFTPISMQLAREVKHNPLMYCIASGFAASHCFLLPVGTPGNLIVQSAAKVPTSKMAVAGIGPTISTIIITWLAVNFYAPIVWPILKNPSPDWLEYRQYLKKLDTSSIKDQGV